MSASIGAVNLGNRAKGAEDKLILIARRQQSESQESTSDSRSKSAEY